MTDTVKLPVIFRVLYSGDNSLGAADAVGGCREDAPCVACALAAGIDAADIALIVLAPWDFHRGGGAALHRRQNGVGSIVAPQLTA